MSDSKDSQNGKDDPFSQLTDMESTVRIDFGASQNVVSTSDNPSVDDFEKTLDGLTDIDDILKNDEIADHGDEEPAISFSTDKINFDELDADINGLSEDFPGEESVQDEKLDDLDDLLVLEKDNNESDTPFEEQTIAFDIDEKPAAESDNSSDDWPLLNDEDTDDSPATDPLLDASEAFDMQDMTNEDEKTADAEDSAPVIELTEEMIESASNEMVTGEPVSDEVGRLPHEADNIDDHADMDQQDESTDSPEENLDHIAEMPGLTTTETNILAGAAAAIHEIAEEEKMHETEAMKESVERHPVAPAHADPKRGGGLRALPTILALLAVAAGGFGAWTAWESSNRVADLETQIRNMQSAKANSVNRQSIVDIQQRLTKVERRLTGTPTTEAAATLGEDVAKPEATNAPGAEVATAAQEMAIARGDVPVAKAIIPETKMAQSQSAGDWVVNLSSHVKESAAATEKARLVKMGLNAEVHSATIKNKVWYRVQIVGFTTKDEAKRQLRDIQQRSGINGAWVGKK